MKNRISHRNKLKLASLWLTLTTALLGQTASSPAKPGILVLAHGGSASWNNAVLEIARTVDEKYPAEVAFGMATRANIQQGIDRLAGRGAQKIIAVPLFISPHSSVITATEYLLGQRSEMPEDLKLFARMSHGGAHAPDEHGTHPVQTTLPIRMTPALGRHPIVADILLSRARSMSTDPAEEVVILVAHGPSPERENVLWLADMKALAEQMSAVQKFHRIDYLTLRDDAPAPIREAATKELRTMVEAAKAEGKRALIVPLLLAYGGIEAGLKKRLEGLDYTVAQRALLPDERLASWILASAEAASQ
jgi:sirohydrochlorin cobaltochelatase